MQQLLTIGEPSALSPKAIRKAHKLDNLEFNFVFLILQCYFWIKLSLLKIQNYDTFLEANKLQVKLSFPFLIIGCGAVIHKLKQQRVKVT